MFDTADVLIDRQPVVDARIDHGRGIVAAREAQEIPRRIHEGVHRVGFAAGGGAAFGAAALEKCRILGERIPGTIGHQVFGQNHGQIGIRHRDGAAVSALNDRDRATPISLP